MSILSKKKTSTLWILLVQGGSYSYKVELTFTNDVHFKINRSIDTLLHTFIGGFVLSNHIFIICGEVKKYNPNHKNIRISIQDHHTFIKNNERAGLFNK